MKTCARPGKSLFQSLSMTKCSSSCCAPELDQIITIIPLSIILYLSPTVLVQAFFGATLMRLNAQRTTASSGAIGGNLWRLMKACVITFLSMISIMPCCK